MGQSVSIRLKISLRQAEPDRRDWPVCHHRQKFPFSKTVFLAKFCIRTRISFLSGTAGGKAEGSSKIEMRDKELRCVKLRDVTSYMDRSVNVIGIVVEFSIPRKSSGTHFCTILKIIDQSQQSPELCVNVFMNTIDALPRIRSRKDIIFLFNVKIESYRGTASAVFYARTSSFALFDGRISDDFTPYQVSPNFLPLLCDKELVRRLRNWSQISSFDAGISEHVTPLKDIKEGDFIDLVCEVLHVCEVSGKWMLFVWDGTDAPALCLKPIKCEPENSASEEIELVALPRNVLLGFPRVGTVLRVIVDDAFGNVGDNIRNIRGWVRIRNVLIKTESGLWKGILTPTTKIRPLCKDNNSVIERLRDYDKRISNQEVPGCERAVLQR